MNRLSDNSNLFIGMAILLLICGSFARGDDDDEDSSSEADDDDATPCPNGLKKIRSSFEGQSCSGGSFLSRPTR